METPAWVWPCGGKRRALGRLRPTGPGHLNAVGPGTFKRCGDAGDGSRDLDRGSVRESGQLGRKGSCASANAPEGLGPAGPGWNAGLRCCPGAAWGSRGEGFPPLVRLGSPAPRIS